MNSQSNLQWSSAQRKLIDEDANMEIAILKISGNKEIRTLGEETWGAPRRIALHVDMNSPRMVNIEAGIANCFRKKKQQQKLSGSHSATQTQASPSRTQCPIFNGVAAEKPTDHALLCHLWQATMHSFDNFFMFHCCACQGSATVTLSNSKHWRCPPQGRHHQLSSDANLPQPSKTWRRIAVVA